jgi:hypothetical protein
MIGIEKLTCLGVGAKQRIVAASTFLTFVETNGGTFGMSLGGLN